MNSHYAAWATGFRNKHAMHVVTAHPDDIPGWLVLAAEVEPLFGPMIEDSNFHTALSDSIAQDRALCIRENDGPPGTPLMGGLLFTPLPSKHEIDWLAVAQRWQRHGVGEALVEHVLGLVQPPGEVVLLTFAEGVPAGEPARRFYEKHGFFPAESGPVNPAGYRTQVFRRLIGPPPTVRAVIQHEDRFLLAQHHYKNPTNWGKWSLPGGVAEPTDLDRPSTLRRELQEELQIDVQILRYLATYTYRNRQHHIYHVRPLSTDLTIDPAEVLAVGWFTITDVQAHQIKGTLYADFMLDAIRAALNHKIR